MLLVLFAGVTSTACGGKQQPEESSESTVEEVAPTCVEEGWAQPPEAIGDTPPSQFPSPDTLKPFEHADPDGSSSSSPAGVEADQQSTPGANRSTPRRESESDESSEPASIDGGTADESNPRDANTTNESNAEESQ